MPRLSPVSSLVGAGAGMSGAGRTHHALRARTLWPTRPERTHRPHTSMRVCIDTHAYMEWPCTGCVQWVVRGDRGGSRTEPQLRDVMGPADVGTPSTPARVFVSLAAFGPTQHIQLAVDNALRFVDPWRLALHISAQFHVSGLRWRYRPVRWERVVLNPVHIRVRRFSSDVLAIHLSNAALLFSLSDAHQPTGSERVLLLPGNAALFRPCGPILASAPLSFGTQDFSDTALRWHRPSETWALPTISKPAHGWPALGPHHIKCTDFPRKETIARADSAASSTGCSRYKCRRRSRRDASPDCTYHCAGTRLKPPPSAAWDTLMELTQKGISPQFELERCSINSWSRTLIQWAHITANATLQDGGAATPPLRPAPLAISPHEGSWYPADVLRLALRAFANTPFSIANLTEQFCPFRLRGVCTVEESVLPSFALQRFPDLVQRSRPPLVTRTFFTFGRAVNTSTPALKAVLAAARRPDAGFCGIKFARDPHTADRYYKSGGAPRGGILKSAALTLLEEIQSKTPAWSEHE